MSLEIVPNKNVFVDGKSESESNYKQNFSSLIKMIILFINCEHFHNKWAKKFGNK